jgi:hypothetical protein
MKRFLFVLLLGTSTTFGQVGDTTAIAPFPPKSNLKSGFLAEFGFSSAVTSLPAIRSFFRENRIKADSRVSSFYSSGFGYRHKRLKIMFLLSFGIDPEVYYPSDSSLVARRQYQSANNLSLGYAIVNSRNRRVYLNAGIGGIRYEYTIFRPTSRVVSFQNILTQTPTGSIPSLVLTNGYWDINAEFSQPEKQSPFQFMFRIGYRRGWRPNAWASDAYQIVGGPADRISQFYGQAGIYYSLRFKKRRES